MLTQSATVAVPDAHTARPANGAFQPLVTHRFTHPLARRLRGFGATSSKAIDLAPDLVIAAGDGLVDLLAVVTASHLDQQFLGRASSVAWMLDM